MAKKEGNSNLSSQLSMAFDKLDKDYDKLQKNATKLAEYKKKQKIAAAKKAKKQKTDQNKVETMFLKNIVAQLNFKNLIKPELQHKRNEIFKKLEELDYLLKIEVPVKPIVETKSSEVQEEPENSENEIQEELNYE